MQDQITLFGLLEKSLPLVGVIIGALLTPAVDTLFSNRKAKKKVKADLIQNVYIYYNYRKAHVETSNLSSLYNALMNQIKKDIKATRNFA